LPIIARDGCLPKTVLPTLAAALSKAREVPARTLFIRHFA